MKYPLTLVATVCHVRLSWQSFSRTVVLMSSYFPVTLSMSSVTPLMSSWAAISSSSRPFSVSSSTAPRCSTTNSDANFTWTETSQLLDQLEIEKCRKRNRPDLKSLKTPFHSFRFCCYFSTLFKSCSLPLSCQTYGKLWNRLKAIYVIPKIASVSMPGKFLTLQSLFVDKKLDIGVEKQVYG